MKTPFTLLFEQANPSLRTTAICPFAPHLSLPFVQPENTRYLLGDDCQVIFRWHDGFDVFVAVLEIISDGPLTIPLKSHLKDLHLIYQLHGESKLLSPAGEPLLRLSGSHHMPVYTPPAQGMLQVQPDACDGRYVLAAVVPKSAWLTRYTTVAESPLEDLIRVLKQRYVEHRHLEPAPISPDIRAWLQLLFSTPRQKGMQLDNALNGYMIKLLETHRAEYLRSKGDSSKNTLADTAYTLIEELLENQAMEVPLSVRQVSDILGEAPKTLCTAHLERHDNSFYNYIQQAIMKRAKRYLDEGMSIKFVGLTLGYGSVNNFSRSFKKQVGLSPREYRKQSVGKK